MNYTPQILHAIAMTEFGEVYAVLSLRAQNTSGVWTAMSSSISFVANATSRQLRTHQRDVDTSFQTTTTSTTTSAGEACLCAYSQLSSSYTRTRNFNVDTFALNLQTSSFLTIVW